MQTSIKKEVSCKALEPIFHYARLNNIDLYTLIHDVPYDLPYLLNKRERIEWWVWSKIVSNSRKYFSQSEYEKWEVFLLEGVRISKDYCGHSFCLYQVNFQENYTKQSFKSGPQCLLV